MGETGASVSSPVHLHGRIESEKEIHSLLKSAPADERERDANMILLLLLFTLTLGAVSPSDGPEVKLQQGNCEMAWFKFNNRYYKYVATRMTYAKAELNCLSQGANLVSIHSLDEHNFVQTLIEKFDHANGRIWIGLSDLQEEGSWMWSDERERDANMILLLLLFTLTLGAVSPSDEPEVKLQRGNCPLFWYSFNNRCYKYVSTQMTWADAELYCVSQGANLVSIHSLEEENFITALIKNFDHAEGRTWIGLSDLHKEGRWMWSDGSAEASSSILNELQATGIKSRSYEGMDHPLYIFRWEIDLNLSYEPEVKLQRGNCPLFWYSFNNRCYKYMETQMTWADAELYCVSQGANLVSIHSLVEDTSVQFLITNFDHAYGRVGIGLSDLAKDGIFMWSDGCVAKCYRWSIEEPNNLHGNEDCVEKGPLPDTKWKWNDLHCNVLFPSVCASRIICPQ
ncbi:unnamed protein product [Pleuronectes platessa]|uniref:C-type lectin domain-containing protein n=1 Tax=Pleuronectes platessa TaxID=8262 RepID=A0A9N7YQU5_PLEPL|nr:unnamed protein product [Pleuronectes platessa]